VLSGLMGKVEPGSPSGTFLASFGVLISTDRYRWCFMGIDFSGECQQDGSGIILVICVGMQGSKVVLKVCPSVRVGFGVHWK
jgi:hypothetical protein